MNERTIAVKIPEPVAVWLEEQAAALMNEIRQAEGGETPADLVTASDMAAAFINHHYEDYTGLNPVPEGQGAA